MAPDLFGRMLDEFSGDWVEIVPEGLLGSTASIEDFAEIDGIDVHEFRERLRTRRPGVHTPEGRDVPLDDLERGCQRLADG